MRASCRITVIGLLFLGLIGCRTPASAQYVANSLAELRNYASIYNDATITLSDTGGDPHPVSGSVRPGIYWINGDHIADPTGTTPIFLDLGGEGNTYNFGGTTIKLDTRKLDGFGRSLGHESSIRVVRLSGSSNTVNDITLIGQDLALDTDPDAQRWADWAADYMRVEGDGNTVDGAHILSRGSLLYGVSDAFGKGGRTDPQGLPADEGGWPLLNGPKASNFLVRDATNTTINNIHLDVSSFGHGFYVQKASNTTLTNSTVTGELVPATDVINHPLYQEYGLTTFGTEIPEDIFISAGEDGVRAYGNIDGVGVEGLKVENVTVTNMRQGFAVSVVQQNQDTGIAAELTNVGAYGNEVGFTPGTYDVITNAKGDIENGPLVWFQYNNIRDVILDLELVGEMPVGQDYAVAYLNGQRLDVTISSDLDLGDLPEDSMVRLGQTYFDNWRDNTHPTGPEDSDPGDFIESTITNNTNQMLVLGQLATNNTISSQAPIVPNGKDTPYDGLSYVPSGLRVILTHEMGLGNNGRSADGTLDANASIVADGGTLELDAGIQVSDEKLTITGDGVGGIGALYAAGSGSRFGTSSSLDESTIVLDGDASIGVDGDLLVGRIQGIGNLTKLGSGKLSLEKSSTFTGTLIVAEGEVSVRGNGLRYGLTVIAGASITSLDNNAYNTTHDAVINGTLDLNGRTDENTLTQRIGSLSGSGTVTSTNPTAGAASVLELVGDSDVGLFLGAITGSVSLLKSGSNSQILVGDQDYTGTTTVSGGSLLAYGTHSGGGDFHVGNEGILGGTATILSKVTVASGGTLMPGASAGAGVLTVSEAQLLAGATLEIEIGGTASGAQYDSFTTIASLMLGGDLAISLLDDGGGLFLPNSNDILTIVSAGTAINGFFANAADEQRIDTRGGEGSFLVNYDNVANSIFLSDFLHARLTGDYNQDGIVDAADYAVWRDALDQTGVDAFSGADGNGDGQVTQADYLVWQENYGAVSTTSNRPLIAVPEPSTLLLLPGAWAFLPSLVRCHSHRREVQLDL